ncbi:MAG: InlB B-repeat-containing protein [Anaerolineales bacterium]
MLFRVMSRWVVIWSLLVLAACGGGSGSDAVRSVTLEGRVVNGPLDGATVTVRTVNGEVLATAVTNATGHYSAVLEAPPTQLRVTAMGGQLAGNPYLGELSAACAVPGSGSGLTCHVTPYSSIASRLVDDHGMTLTAANAALFTVFRLNYDPFIRDIGPDGPVTAEYFDMAAARTAINGGVGLDSWLGELSSWVVTPFVGTAPPGTPVYNIVATVRTGTGSVTPLSQQVAMGGQAAFTVTAGANHIIDRIAGCGGTLVGDVYTTAPVISVGATTGVCSVEVRFALEKFPVEYVATEGGTIIGAASQLISFGGSSSEVEAEAEPGYFFVDWSDGNPSATRIDTNISSALTMEARFQRESYTLKYIAGANGSLAGILEQTVLFGDSGSPVTASPDPGYAFIRWSDSPVSNPRTDSNVARSIEVTAQFEALPASTPFLQGLHFGEMRIDIAGPTRAEISWPAEIGSDYDLFISPTADVVLDQESGFLIPPFSPSSIAEKIKILMDNPLLRDKMGNAGYKRAIENYTAESYCQEIDNLYTHLLQSKGIIAS